MPRTTYIVDYKRPFHRLETQAIEEYLEEVDYDLDETYGELQPKTSNLQLIFRST